jgi:hypothetical protein
MVRLAGDCLRNEETNEGMLLLSVSVALKYTFRP